MHRMELKPNLVDAIRNDNYIRVEELMRDGEDVSSWRDDLGETPVVFACQLGSSHVFNHLISSGCSVQEKDSRGCSLLEIAVEGAHPDIVKILYEHGADLNQKLSKTFDVCNKNMPFHGDSLVNLVVNTVLEKHRTHQEEKHASKTILNFFHYNNLPLPDKSINGTSLVDELLIHRVEDTIIEKLIKAHSEINLQSPVQQAVFFAFPESLLESLVARGYSVNAVSDTDWCPPLFYVCSGLKSGWEDDSLPMLELFLKYGADVNIKSKQAFNVSTHRRLPELTWKLGSQVTALHVAVLSKSELCKSDLVYTLCKHGADVNSQTESGDTPLILAVKNLYQVKSDERHGLYRYRETDTCVIQTLLQFGADPDNRNNNQESCLKLALELDGYDSVKLMLLDTFTDHKLLKDVVLEDVTVSNLAQENLSRLCSSPRNLKVLARKAILKATKGRHQVQEESLDVLPDVVSEYVKMDYYYADWFDNPWTLYESCMDHVWNNV